MARCPVDWVAMMHKLLHILFFFFFFSHVQVLWSRMKFLIALFFVWFLFSLTYIFPLFFCTSDVVLPFYFFSLWTSPFFEPYFLFLHVIIPLLFLNFDSILVLLNIMKTQSEYSFLSAMHLHIKQKTKIVSKWSTIYIYIYQSDDFPRVSCFQGFICLLPEQSRYKMDILGYTPRPSGDLGIFFFFFGGGQ